MLNIDCKTSYHQFDNWGMCIIPTNSLSHRDSVGRTVLCWIAYGKPEKLINSVLGCYHPNHTVPKYRLRRHPARCDIASRDHWSYFIIQSQLDAPNWLKLEMSRYFPLMRGLYLWMHSLTGNKFFEHLYYLIYIPGARLGNWLLFLLRWIGRIKPERDNKHWIDMGTWYIPGGGSYKITDGNYILHNRTKWQKAWAWIIFKSMPAYALHNKAWQLYVMPESKAKERLKGILLKRVGKSNIMLRLLFEPKVIYNAEYLKGSYKLVTQEEIDNYPNMAGYRPGVYLDETCRRTIREMTTVESEFNTYERDLIFILWNECFNF